MPNNKNSRQRQRRKEQMKRHVAYHHRQLRIDRNLQAIDYAEFWSD